MKLENENFIVLNYIQRVKDTGKEIEKQDNLLVIIGENQQKLLEKELLKTDIDESNIGKLSQVFDIVPKDAYGERIPNNMRTVPLRYFRQKQIMPTIHLMVDYNGRMARVQSVSSGRVLLDFNHQYAGKTIQYTVTINKVITDNVEKMKALLNRRIPALTLDKIDLTAKTNGEVVVFIPEQVRYLDGLPQNKKAVVMDIKKYIPEITSIRYVEDNPIPRKIEISKDNIKKESEKSGR